MIKSVFDCLPIFFIFFLSMFLGSSPDWHRFLLLVLHSLCCGPETIHYLTIFQIFCSQNALFRLPNIIVHLHSEHIVLHFQVQSYNSFLHASHSFYLIDRNRLLKHLADPCSITLTVGIFFFTLFLLCSLLSVMHWVIKSLMDVAVEDDGNKSFFMYHFVPLPQHTSPSMPVFPHLILYIVFILLIRLVLLLLWIACHLLI